jgi:hypothetical protein
VAWHGLVPVVVGSPFGSPVSLAPLTSSKHEGQPEARYPLAMGHDLGVVDDGEPDIQPREPGAAAASTSTQHRSVQARFLLACRRPRRQIA